MLDYLGTVVRAFQGGQFEGGNSPGLIIESNFVQEANSSGQVSASVVPYHSESYGLEHRAQV